MTDRTSRSAPEARVELLEALNMHLAWASRFNPDSSSRKVLRTYFARPDVLDLLESLVSEALVAASPVPEEQPNE